MTYEDLLAIAGAPVKAHVLQSKRDTAPGMVSFEEVKKAIAFLSGYSRINDQSELGVGCWLSLIDDGQNTRFDCDRWRWGGCRMELKRITHPRYKSHLLDFDSSDGPWYDFDTLKSNVEACDSNFALAAMNEANNLFTQFRWVHPASVVTITGLVLATWIQSIWEWRPQVAITGPTKAGKDDSVRCA